jgi:hypothetical protein
MKTILVSLLLLGGAAYADDKKAPEKKEDKKAQDKITGEVVDITCLANHGAQGEKHAACASKCLAAGMPAGILAGGKLYVATMADHTAPNTKLAAWAGKEVVATGTAMEKDGTHIFEISTVEPAAAPAKKEAAPAKK